MALIEISPAPYLNFKCEILLEILDDHDEEGQFDAEGFLGVCGTRDVGGAVESRHTDQAGS